MLTGSPSYDIRYTTALDAPSLKSWLEKPGMLHFFPISEENEIENAVNSWISFYKYKASLTATIDGKPCGIATLFLSPYRKVAHHSFFKIIVDPQYQRQGVGASLLKNIKHLAKTLFRLDIIHIEIIEGNPIAHLLEKYQFELFMRQERYFKEDGKYYARLLYKCYLSKEVL
ncbi:MAG: GNAT family N-acetyltransferase [Chlamydiae bacterium]|nr:GNAT family N-acetyltransferase [Chlamydiota bacterium]